MSQVVKSFGHFTTFRKIAELNENYGKVPLQTLQMKFVRVCGWCRALAKTDSKVELSGEVGRRRICARGKEDAESTFF